MSQVKDADIDDIIAKVKEKNRHSDIKLIKRAYEFAKANHGDQLRKSGEPYIIHPIQVGYILADIGLDESTICAALLHDVVEDTPVTREELEKEFGCHVDVVTSGIEDKEFLSIIEKDKKVLYAA